MPLQERVVPAKAGARREPLVWVMLAGIVLTMVLYLTPQLRMVAYPLLLLSTFAHEMGHGVAALLVGGKFHAFVMFSDGSGVAQLSLPPTRTAAAISSMGGLLGPAIVATGLLILGTRQRWARWSLWGVAIVSAVCVVWVVRSFFGAGFILGFAAIIAAIARWGRPTIQQFTLVFLALQLGLSVFSRSDYLFTDYAQTAQGPMPSDVQYIADALFGPYWFWGGVVALMSLAILYFGLRVYVGAVARNGDAKRLRGGASRQLGR